MQSSEERMQSLHRATLRLYSDLSSEGVLRRIIEAARDLTGARYAALSIPDADGGLKTFLPVGMTAEEMAKIAHLPKGKGLIGEMLKRGESIRIPRISAHPKSIGFPAGHPPMDSFLGVPIAAFGSALGQIYLTEKIGASEFSEEDQHIIEMLAAHAAAAIENSRLIEQISENQSELSQRNEQLELIDHLTSVVSSSMEIDELLKVILHRARELFGADWGEIYLRDLGKNVYRLALHQGGGAPRFWETELFEAGEGVIGHVAESGEPFFSNELERDLQGLMPGFLNAGGKAIVCVPMTARLETVGVLCLVFPDQPELTARDLGLLAAVGTGVGMAVNSAWLNRQSRRLAVLEERERIGMDLHDGIIQSIYAVGLTLESTRLQVANAKGAAPREFDQVIDGLNAVIRDIRAYILDLQPKRMLDDDLGKALEALAVDFGSTARIEVELVLEPQAMQRLAKKASMEIYYIVQESLANVAKHALASKVWISIRRDDENLLVQVIDNGRGFDLKRESRVLGHGLSNMAIRANAINGSCEVTSEPGEGTVVSISIRPPRTPSS